MVYVIPVNIMIFHRKVMTFLVKVPCLLSQLLMIITCR